MRTKASRFYESRSDFFVTILRGMLGSSLDRGINLGLINDEVCIGSAFDFDF